MKENFLVSDEWKILRNLVSAYYKQIKSVIAKSIYFDTKESYKKVYSEEQIASIQRGRTCSALKVVYNSISSRFFDIQDFCEKSVEKDWQDKLSLQDLTKLALLLNKSLTFIKLDKSDYTYIENKIRSIEDEEFLSLRTVNSKNNFKKSKKLDKSEIEDKENIKFVFEKNLKQLYDDYKRVKLFVKIPEYQFEKEIDEFIEKTDFSVKEQERKQAGFVKKTCENVCFDINNNRIVLETYENGIKEFKVKKNCQSDEGQNLKNIKYLDSDGNLVEEIGTNYDGITIYKKTFPTGEIKYFADDEEIEIEDVQFYENDENRDINTSSKIKKPIKIKKTQKRRKKMEENDQIDKNEVLEGWLKTFYEKRGIELTDLQLEKFRLFVQETMKKYGTNDLYELDSLHLRILFDLVISQMKSKEDVQLELFDVTPNKNQDGPYQ
jgi:hypothetical protein